MSFADFGEYMEAFSNFVWSTPTALLLTGVGLIFTLMTLGIQFKALTHGFAVIRGKYDNPEDAGNISHFQALCAALSATIGLGNIAGVGVAVSTGGPGAIFWMWVVGFLGMATKFTTCSLATMYRKRDKFGEYRGGPMYYIELGLGGNATTTGMKALAKALAVLFAFLGMCASVGAGNMFQANQVAKIFVNLFKQNIPGGIGEQTQFTIQMVMGAVICLFAVLVIIGGIKRIGSVASKLVPSMCVIYVTGALYIIFKNAPLLPEVIASIFESAFSVTAGAGAFFGIAVRQAMMLGVKRACFSNEAGLGSAPIAHATAKTNEPIREGVVAAVGPFIDTIVICTMTALVILVTNTHSRGPVGMLAAVGEPQVVEQEGLQALNLEIELQLTEMSAAKVGESLFIHKAPEEEGAAGDNIQFAISSIEADRAKSVLTYSDDPEGRADLEQDRALLQPQTDVFLFRDGVELTALAFDTGLAGFGTYFIPVAALLFAFSTIISWGFYGETCAEYLFGERAVLPFKIVFVAMILVGTAFMELKPVLDWSDGMLGLMLVPNLVGTFLLAPVVMRETKKYFRRLNSGEFDKDVQRAAEYRRRKKDRR